MGPAPSFNYKGTYDENWPLPQHLTLDQYSHVFFRPDAHFVEGRIVPRSLGDWIHSHTVGALIGEVHPLEQKASFRCCISLRLRTAADRIRVCDFVVLAPGAPREQVPTFPPLLCVEVLSPEQVPSDELETLADYLAMGVQQIWLIDPTHHSAFTFDSDGLHEADPTSLTVAGTPIRVDLTEAFATLD